MDTIAGRVLLFVVIDLNGQDHAVTRACMHVKAVAKKGAGLNLGLHRSGSVRWRPAWLPERARTAGQRGLVSTGDG